MKRLLFSAAILLCALAGIRAQNYLSFREHFRIEIALTSFTAKQTGQLYLNSQGHTPPIYEVHPIEQKFGHVGIGVHFWYAWNFGYHSFDRCAYGIEAGFNYNTGTQLQGISIGEDTAKCNLRMPVLFGVRTRGAIDPAVYGRVGLGLAAGVELIRSSIANVDGNFIVPKVQGLFTFKRLMITFSYYPVHVKSFYLLNGVKTERLNTSFLEWSFRYTITWYNKKYRRYRTMVKL